MQESIFGVRKVFAPGDSHRAIWRLRWALDRLGYLAPRNRPRNVADVFEPQLIGALQRYQRFHDLSVSGRVDEETALHLDRKKHCS